MRNRRENVNEHQRPPGSAPPAAKIVAHGARVVRARGGRYAKGQEPAGADTAADSCERTGNPLGERFRRIAARVACAVGSPWSFAGAVLLVLVWAAVGPSLGYSENWQLVINTGTTIATFLMLFVLQNSQNRDTKAVNIKLDELLRAIEGARTGLAMAGDLSDQELEELEQDFRRLATKSDAAADVTDVRPVRAGAAE